MAQSPSERGDRRPLWRHWPLLLVYLGLAVLATWPLAARLTTHLPTGTDTLSHYWNGWATLQALRDGRSPYFSPDIFYPTGASTVFKNYAWLHVAGWIALRPLVGGTAAYNLVFLLALALCGWAAYLFVYELTGDRRAAFVAGTIYLLWPYRLTQPSHPNMISTAAIPLLLLFIRRTLRRGRWQDGLWTGLCLALAGYTRWQLLVPAAMMGGIYALWNLPRGLDRRTIGALALGGLVSVLLLAPPALLLAREMRSTPASLTKEDEEWIMQTDVLAYLTPPSSHTALGRWTEPAYQRYYAGRGSRFVHSPYVGLAGLALAVVGIARRRLRDTLPWLAIALLMFLLALGPALRVNGKLYENAPMFYNLAIRVPGIQLMRVPERFNMFIALPAAVLAAFGVSVLLGQRTIERKSWRRVLAVVSIVAVILFEYLVIPYPLQAARVSAFYSQLAAEPERFAILNVPVDPYASKPYMYAQTVHGHPMVQGRLTRFPEGVFDYLDGQPWIRAMRRYTDVPPRQRDISRQLNALAQDGIRYLIVHKSLIGEEHWSRWERYLAVEPRYEDAEIAAYSTAPVAGQDFELTAELVPGLGVVRAMPSNLCARPEGVLEVDVAWGATAPPGRDLDVVWTFVSQDGVEHRGGGGGISPGWPSGEWPANAVAWGYYTIAIPDDLAAGVYDLTVGLAAPETGAVQGKAAAVGRVQVQDAPCVLPVPDDAVGVNAMFGDVMRLLGYRLDQDDMGVELTLLWRPERRIETDYKVFVHIFDPATGIPVAQDDAMPLHWTYPTSYWAPGEWVTDAIAISAEDVSPGTYGIAVGVYDPANGERLSVQDSSGQVQADGRMVLPAETVTVE